MSLQLSDTFSLPKEAALWTIGDLAIKGAGKTYDAAKLAEQMVLNNIPIVVLDPMGIWWGLRVGVSNDGLPIVIFGGDHADLPIPTILSKDKKHNIIDEMKLRQVTVAILQAGLSVVFDTSKLSDTQQTRAVAIFCDELYEKNGPYGIRHVFIEEADEYCPQEPMGEKRESKAAVDQLVRRGGNKNIGVTMITQRPAVVNKNVLSQCGCLFILRIQWAKDKDVIRDWVRNTVKDEREVKKLAKWYDTLKELKNGEAWVYSPEHDIFEKVQFGQRQTLHATREYFLKEAWEQKNITLRDVSQFVKAYKAKIEPKPLVELTKPVVARQISRLGSGYTRNEHETAEAKPPVKTTGEVSGYSTGKTTGETRSQTAEMGKVDLHIPTWQAEDSEMRLQDRGAFPRTSGAQQRSALGQTPEDDRTVNLDLVEVDYNIRHINNETFDFSTKNQDGKVLYVMLNDLKREPSSISEIAEALAERAWTMKDTSLKMHLVTFTQKGLLIKEGKTADTKYRLPRHAKIRAVND